MGRLPHRGIVGFNPRAREGRDPRAMLWCVHSGVSIHAPVKDATRQQRERLLPPAVSIHAPVKDATNVEISKFRLLEFQSTRP